MPRSRGILKRKMIGFPRRGAGSAARRTSRHRRGAAPRQLDVSAVVAAVVMVKRISGGNAGDQPAFVFTSEQWEKISRLSGIPKNAGDAWRMMEVSIAQYRSRKAHRESVEARPAKIREELRALSKATWKIYERLQLLEERSPPDFPLSFNGELAMLREVEVRLSLAASEIGNSKPGPITKDVYVLVGRLAGILDEYTGKRISRSRKRGSPRDYLKTVCEIADEDIGDGTIEEAMKSLIKRRGAVSGKFDR